MAQKTIEFQKAAAEAVQEAPEPRHERNWKPDDDTLVLGLAPKLREKVAHFHADWKIYEHGVWNTRHVSKVRQQIREELRHWRGSGVQVNQGRIRAIADMLADDLFTPDQAIKDMHEERRRYVNLRNGLFNLERMELEPHRKELYFTTQLSFDYDPEARCPTFDTYLRTSLVNPDGSQDLELIYLVLQGMGYSMTARTDLKSSFWLVGEKDSGKSTFISVLKNLMGDLHVTLDLNQLGTNRFLLAAAVGKRVISFTEATEGSVLNDAIYKTLTGGSDDISADVKNKDPINFRPEGKVWWAMNGLPRITDRSGATTRRIIIIPFNRSVPQHLRIHDLEGRLKAEASGIFNRVMFGEGYERLVNGGNVFEHCEQSAEAMRQYIADNDTEATFVEQCTDRHESYRVRGGELYAAYAAWCTSNGFRAKNSNQVAKDWRRLGFDSRPSNGIWWHGLKVRESN